MSNCSCGKVIVQGLSQRNRTTCSKECRQREYRHRRYPVNRALVAAFRANGCSRCPEKDPVCLDAHHAQADKDVPISVAVFSRTPYQLTAELKKCICLCRNCHAKEHARLRAEGGGPPSPGRQPGDRDELETDIEHWQLGLPGLH